ncbi:ferric reductase transmembrane component [Stipitochalara longipes BDJ]|nr:ferric reductase transmembrane component [Stipitochalara longipes BDJ]
MESQWLQDAIRMSLRTSTEGEKGPPEQRDPQLHKLAEGIIFSRKFVPTYNLVILGFICLLSASHWTEKILRWRRRQAYRLQLLRTENAYDNPIKSNVHMARGQELDGIHSFSCSTVEGMASPPRKDLGERAPLLHSQGSRRSPHLGSFYCTAKAISIYQPRPIPIVNKILPSNGTSIVLLAFIALNIFYIFFHINLNIFELFILADRFGMIFVANLPFLYVLAAKNQPLKFLTGWSYESLNIFHRRLGELLCLTAFFHSAGMIAVWYTLFRLNGFELTQFLLIKMVLLGIGAFISYELLYLTSLASFRQCWYELFLGTHVVLQVFALTFIFFHHETARPYVGIALGIFLLDRLVYRIGIKSVTIGTYTKILEDEDTVRLTSTVFLQPRSLWIPFFGSSLMSGWKATDHVFLTVPSLSSKHLIQAHPFTISSKGPLADDDEGRLELLIRAQDGFSRNLLNAARLHKHLMIRVDGPYGNSHARTMLEDSDLAIVVVGGSGIAVGFPLVHHLLDVSRSTDTEIAPTFMLLRQKIVLIWVIHEEAHLSWVGRPALADAENRGAEIIVPQATEEIGRPDLKGMIREIVETFANGDGKKTRVATSGPDSMGRAVRNTCAGLVREGWDIDVVIEKFGW